MSTKAPVRVGLHQAKTHFSELLRRVEAGEEVTILRRGKAVARLVPSREPGAARPLGSLRGQWQLPPASVLVGSDPELEALFYDEDA
ncbi:MAG TPA: type II toxin-antitoxin system prevent-host-death family antitoxin [Rhodothermales bacterium]|nr:type II toxin-antitoxin system prevent-host-death family antitoxin [Rhodothermales bacterium]